MENVLSADNVSFGYRNSLLIADLALSLKQGEVVSVVGPNGSGKSTVLRLLSRLLEPRQGVVYLDGKSITLQKTKDVARRLAMLPQTQDHFLDISVRDLVRQGRNPHLGWFEESRGEHEDKVDWAIEMTDLTDLQFRPLHTLSGGERQRAWIAMAVAQNPKVLLLDEPTTYLDIAHQLEIMELLLHLNRTQKLSILMVLHDLNQASRYSDRIVAMKDGHLIGQGAPTEVLQPDFFEQVFGIEATIVYDEEGRPLYTPKGLAGLGGGRRKRYGAESKAT